MTAENMKVSIRDEFRRKMILSQQRARNKHLHIKEDTPPKPKVEIKYEDYCNLKIDDSIEGQLNRTEQEASLEYENQGLNIVMPSLN